MSHAFSGVWTTAAAVFLALLAGREMAAAAALPFKPIPAYSPELQAQREAAGLKKEAQNLVKEGRLKEAREKWQEALAAYRRSGYKSGESEILIRLGASCQAEVALDPQKLTLMLDYIAQGVQIGAEYLVGIAQQEDPVDKISFEKAEDLFRQASDLSGSGDCPGALPLFLEAGQLYGKAGSAVGELRALDGRLQCQFKGGDQLGGILGFGEFHSIAGKLKLAATPAAVSVFHLKAVEDSELGRWKNAAEPYRTVLRWYEATSDSANAALTALDLGGLLAQMGNLDEAEALFERAGEQLAALSDSDSRRNKAAALQNLADVQFATGRFEAAIPTYRRACEEWIVLKDLAREATALKALGSAFQARGEDVSAKAVLEEARTLEAQVNSISKAEASSSDGLKGSAGKDSSSETIKDGALAIAVPAPLGQDPARVTILVRDPRAQAQREATLLLGEGDRLLEAGQLKEARERWSSAAEAYKKAANGLGEAGVYARIGDSYTSEALFDPSKRLLAMDYQIRAMMTAAEVYGGVLPKSLSPGDENAKRAETLLKEASVYVESSECTKALTLTREARTIFRRSGLPLGEFLSLILQARCQVASNDHVGAFMTIVEALPVFESLPAGTPESELASKAEELFKQGKLTDSLAIFQELLCRYEKSQDIGGIARALLDLGLVQSSLGDFLNAESSILRALALLPAIEDEHAAYNEAAARHNLGSHTQVRAGVARRLPSFAPPWHFYGNWAILIWKLLPFRL